MAEHAVDRDADDPRAELCPAVVAVEVLDDLQQSILREVAGFLDISHHPVTDGVDSPLIRLEQLCQRLRIAIAMCFDQLQLAERGHPRRAGRDRARSHQPIVRLWIIIGRVGRHDARYHGFALERVR
jgi:hypothetical protein